MVEYTIVHEEWWFDAYHRKPSATDRQSLQNLESMTKHAFFVFFVSRIEWTFRKLVSHLSPGACNGGLASFKSIYDHLLTHLHLKHFIPLFDLCCLVRNAVHNNGIFVPTQGGDRSVTWDGVVYEFKHLQPIDFMTHDLILQLFSDLMDSIEAILSHADVAAPAFLDDTIQ